MLLRGSETFCCEVLELLPGDSFVPRRVGGEVYMVAEALALQSNVAQP